MTFPLWWHLSNVELELILMASNDYHFISHWRVEATIEEVNTILGNATQLPRWWPAVYLDVQEREPGGPDGVGRVIELFTKGWLPYTLRWCFRVTESRVPFGFTLEAWGDLVGRGTWTFAQEGDSVAITYDWRIRADKPLLRTFSFLMKPLFSFNHQWAMARGEESLKLELQRYHARNKTERLAVPAPPGPTFMALALRTPSTLRRPVIDATMLALCEAGGWEAYYRRDWLRVIWLMLRLNRVQFGMPWLEAVAAAIDTMRAALAFAPVANDLDATHRHLERYFRRARRAAGIRADASTLATRELDYWVVHRELAIRRKADHQDNDLTALVASLAELHAVAFDSSPERMQVSAALRSLAAERVDRITGGYSDDIPADWRYIHQLLRDAYQAVRLVEEP